MSHTAAEERPSASADTIAVTVHGPGGALDLVVPAGATSVDVARVYAAEAQLAGIPLLQTPLGEHLRADRALSDLGVAPGDVLIAAAGVRRSKPVEEDDGGGARLADSPQIAALVACLAVAAAALSGWYAARAGDEWLRSITVALLTLSALAAAVPAGRHAPQRLAAAPAFAAAAAFAAYYEPGTHLLGALVAVAALAAAVTAAISRAMSPHRDQSLTVWIIAGVGVFLVAGLTTWLGWHDRVSWSVLIMLAMLGTRFIPSLAVDVPDEALLDLDRLAVTAWSARDRAGGRRGRIVIPEAAVRRLVDDASRTVTAASIAIAVVTGFAAPLLMASARIDLDRIGARCLLLLAGAGILLAARQYRHAAARRALRVAGLQCWWWLAVFEAPGLSPGWAVAAVVTAVVLGAVCLAVGVAAGRGWRSVWWARRAEVAEGFAGAFALAATVVASGFFRALWEMTS